MLNCLPYAHPQRPHCMQPALVKPYYLIHTPQGYASRAVPTPLQRCRRQQAAERQVDA